MHERRAWREARFPGGIRARSENFPHFSALVPWPTETSTSSQGRFKFHRRRTIDLVSLNALWVDCDFYKKRADWSLGIDALYALLTACDGEFLPHPSYVVGTGRGLCGVWLVEVLPPGALPRWRVAGESLVERFLGFGADTGCTDASRIFRLGGSLNSKAVPAEHVRCVYPEVGQRCTYRFDDLCRVVLPYERPEGRMLAAA